MNWPENDSEIIELLLANEGGYVNRSDDLGGPTKYGVTIDTLASWRKTDVTAADIQALTVDEASALYTSKYIVGPNFDKLNDMHLRAAMVDFGVLFGPIRAIASLQIILKLPPDGILGPNSQAVANSAPDSRPIINKLAGARIGYHADYVTKCPKELPFLRGWISRSLCFIE